MAFLSLGKMTFIAAKIRPNGQKNALKRATQFWELLIHCFPTFQQKLKRLFEGPNEAFCGVHKSNNAGCFLLFNDY